MIMNVEKMKKCKWCGELIPEEAQKCLYCMGWQFSESRTDSFRTTENHTNLLDKQSRKGVFHHYFWTVDIKKIFHLGRACNRKEYWFGLLVWLFISLLPLSVLLFDYGIKGDIRAWSLVIWIVWIAFSILCHLSLAIRRLRDINKRIWWLPFLLLVPPIGNIILVIWFCKPSNRNNEFAKFNIWDTLMLLLITGIFTGACISSCNRDEENRRYSPSQKYEYTDELESAESENDEEKIYAEKSVEEAENKYKEFTVFLETAQAAALKKYNRLKANSSDDDYETFCKLRELKSFYNINFSAIFEELRSAKEYIHNTNYKTATKLAKSVERSIQINRGDIKKKILELNLNVEENTSQNSNSQSSSSSQSSSPEYGTRDVWVDCIECHGSGKCKYCQGSGKCWYGNSYEDCVTCHGSTNCQICYGTRGHYEKQMYQIR